MTTQGIGDLSHILTSLVKDFFDRIFSTGIFSTVAFFLSGNPGKMRGKGGSEFFLDLGWRILLLPRAVVCHP